MRNRKAIIAVEIIAVAAIAIAGLRLFSGEDEWICRNGEWIRHGNPSALKPESGCEIKKEGGSSNLPEPDFIETGNIVSGSANGWKLIYEKPGAPALSAELAFTEKSICDSDGKTVSCDPFWNVGDRVKIEGLTDMQTGKVKIYRMELIK